MKICTLASSFPRYKGDYFLIFVYEIVKRLVKQHKIFVITPNDNKKTKSSEIIDSINIERFNYFFPRSLHRLAYGSGMAENVKNSFLARIQVIPYVISFYFKSLKYAKISSVIHAHVSVSGLVGVLLKKILKKPLVFSNYRLVETNSVMGKINKYIFENTDHIIFISTYLRDKAKSIAKLKSSSVIPLGVDLKKFNPSVKKSDFHKNFDIPKDHKIIFNVGRIIEKKGLKYLIKAMPIVLKKQKCTLVIGGIGIEENRLKKLVKDLKLSNNIKFIGKISHHELPSYFKGSDVFVLPSIIDSKGETETLGVVLIEAMACGCPVIGSKVGGIVDVIDDNVNGFLTRPKDSVDIAEKLMNLLSNPSLRKRFVKNGRKKAEKKFNWDNIALEIEKIYDSFKV